MTNVVKPLLAGKVDLDKLKYPVAATPKLDGIRCLTVEGVAMSRKMKPIPNLFVQEELKCLNGMDGELMVQGDYNEVQSGIMKRTGEPDFTFHVFDSFAMGGPYLERLKAMEAAELDWHPRVTLLMPVMINSECDLLAYLDQCLADGYEGVMVRDPNGRYKFGRSTVNEGILLKLKTFSDSEGVIVDIIEKMTNENELERDEQGYAKRSSAKENKVPAGTAGSVVLEWEGHTFNVGFGPGFTDRIKQEWWDTRSEKINQLAKFSYQELSKDGIPRFGKLLGLRHEGDL